MSRTLTLEVPDELYAALEEMAAEQKRSAEQVGAEWLSATIGRLANDPLLKLAGCFESGIPDLADRHDHYIAEHLADELRNPKP